MRPPAYFLFGIRTVPYSFISLIILFENFYDPILEFQNSKPGVLTHFVVINFIIQAKEYFVKSVSYLECIPAITSHHFSLSQAGSRPLSNVLCTVKLMICFLGHNTHMYRMYRDGQNFFVIPLFYYINYPVSQDCRPLV